MAKETFTKIEKGLLFYCLADIKKGIDDILKQDKHQSAEIPILFSFRNVMFACRIKSEELIHKIGPMIPDMIEEWKVDRELVNGAKDVFKFKGKGTTEEMIAPLANFITNRVFDLAVKFGQDKDLLQFIFTIYPLMFLSLDFDLKKWVEFLFFEKDEDEEKQKKKKVIKNKKNEVTL